MIRPPSVQAGGGFTQGVERAASVNVEVLIEQLIRVLRQRQDFEDTGVVHQHIDFAQLRFGLVEHPAYVVGVRYIRLDRYGLVAGLTQFDHQF